MVVLLWFPETAHRELEELNPEDDRGCRAADGVGGRSGPRLSCLGRRAVVSAPPTAASAAVRPGMRARVPTSSARRRGRAQSQETTWIYHCSEPKAASRSSSSKGGEWAVLLLSVAAALLAIGVGFFLAGRSSPTDQGTPKMNEIALAIQEGASAYLKRQFRTIAVILVPLAAIVFFTSTEIIKPDGSEALTLRPVRACSARWPSSSAASRPASPATSA